jgi:LPS-assembly protein
VRLPLLFALVSIASLVVATAAAADELRQRLAGRPLLLVADTLSYDFAAERVVASGHVELSVGDYVLKARQLVYDRRQDRLTAEGEVVLILPDGDALFAERLEVTGDLREGFVQHVGARLDEDVRIAANAATRREGRWTVFEKAVYSPCPITCERPDAKPLWQVRARRVVHDLQKRTLTYEHAVLEFLGVPVAWTPWFSHPDPTVERRTGFLAPAIGSDTELGLTLETPFYIDLAPNRDLTVTPGLATKQGPTLKLELRDLEHFGRTDIGGSIAWAQEHRRRPGDPRRKTLRGHVEGRGDYALADRDRFGFEFALASDNTYLDTFDLSDEDVLTERLYFERHGAHSFASAELLGFQGLRDTDDQDRIPFALPLFEYRRRGGPGPAEGYWDAGIDIASLFRTQGVDSQRFSAEASYEIPRLGRFGDVWQLRASLRGDLYRIDGDPETGSGGAEQVTGRILPRAELSWSWPLVGATGSWDHLVEPQAGLFYDLPGGNDPDIPNEDSLSFEFDETNLFAASRFTGFDRVEEGLRFAWGLRTTSIGPGGFRMSGMIGQLLRFDSGDPFPANVGLEGRYSDLVGRLEIRPSPLFDASYRFRFNSSELRFRRHDAALSFGPPTLRFRVNYVELGGEAAGGGQTTREQVLFALRLQPTDELTLGFQSRYDIDEARYVANAVGLVWHNPCFTLTAGLERRFTSRGELRDETTFKLRIGLATLGDIRTSSKLFE